MLIIKSEFIFLVKSLYALETSWENLSIQ